MTEVDKGAWWIENNGLNFDVSRLLANLGLPDTEENRDRVVKMVQEMVAEMPRVVRQRNFGVVGAKEVGQK